MPSHEYLTKLLLCARVSGQKLNSCVRACRCGRYHSTILSLSPIFNFVWLCLEKAMLILSSLIFSTFLVEKTLSSFFFCLLVWENTGGFSGGNERGKKCSFSSPKIDFTDGILFPSSVAVFPRVFWALEWLLGCPSLRGQVAATRGPKKPEGKSPHYEVEGFQS